MLSPGGWGVGGREPVFHLLFFFLGFHNYNYGFFIVVLFAVSYEVSPIGNFQDWCMASWDTVDFHCQHVPMMKLEENSQ